MALGDGIRRNIAHVSAAERTRFRDAVLKLDRERFFPDGVSYFDKQEDIHKNARFEAILDAAEGATTEFESVRGLLGRAYE
jgi:hypothetical protein